MKFPELIAASAVGLILFACAPAPIKPVTTRNSALTHGNVQMNLKLGETSQTQVLEVFGAPNITSIDGTGQEVWTYQRAATVSQSTSSSGFWTVLLTGPAALLGGQSQEAAGLEQTQRTMTLIIKFDEKKILSDFRSRSSEF
jgi:outer membrane protein assembly factor BamE (lipoprotein component of BamABCDE complex)